MSDDSDIPTPTRSGITLQWGTIVKVVSWALPIIASAVLLYLSSVYVTQAQMADEMRPLKALPMRVDVLEGFRIEHKADQTQSNMAIGTLQQDMAGIKAEIRSLQAESSRNTDRILQRLDSMQAGPRK